MSDREVKKERSPVQSEAQIGPFPILSASLGDGLETCLAQKGHKELEKNGVSGRGRSPPEVSAG
jgi:hypothetical protein